jgi:hypothetical protein
MRTSSVFQLAGAALLALVSVTACRFERAESNPSVLAAPASSDDSPEATRETVVRAARVDLQCAEAAIVLTMDRRYANGSALRYIVDGCGRRALYAESCEDFPVCRYLLVSVIPVPMYSGPPATLGSGAASPSPAAPSGSASTWPPPGSWPAASGSSGTAPAPPLAPSAPSSLPSTLRPGASAPAGEPPSAPRVPAPSSSAKPSPFGGALLL